MLDSVRNNEAVDSLLTSIDDAVTGLSKILSMLQGSTTVYYSGICTTTTTQSRKTRVSSDRVDVTVLRTDFAEEADAFVEFGNGSSVNRAKH